jgi:NTP pyrophosphatase (non-canonical NTP hydrolase)
MIRFEYRTEVLTSMVGRDKLRVSDLEDVLRKFGDEGWELVTLALDADIRGERDGHLLVFKRAVDSS